MAIAIFVCTECANNAPLKEQLCLGFVGIHKCQLCGKEVDTSKERYNVFRKSDLDACGKKIILSDSWK